MHDRTAGLSTRLPGSARAWAAFEGFRNPQVVLCTIYVFAPYYVSTVAASPAAGQATLATAGQWAGWIVALTAPLLGVVVDRMGRRKPGLTAVVLALAAVTLSYWWIVPGGALTAWVVPLFVMSGLFFAWTEVFHNSLLVTSARGQVSKTSGLGLALGNGVSVVALVAVLWAFALPGTVDWPFVPAEPLFGLDRGANEQARIVAPITAALLVVGLIIILTGTPDAPSTGTRLSVALRSGFRDLRALLGELRRDPNAARFLIARMLYADGQNGIVIFAGVLAAGVMGWNTLAMLAFGILMSVIAVIGGLIAAPLDAWLGPKRAVIVEISLAVVSWALLLLTSPARVAGFDVPAERWWGGPVFPFLADLGYLAISSVVAISVTAAYASSRTLLAGLVAPERTGSFFGLYVLSGAATGWLAPALIALATGYTGSQQWGVATLLLLLGSGLALLTTVKAPR